MLTDKQLIDDANNSPRNYENDYYMGESVSIYVRVQRVYFSPYVCRCNSLYIMRYIVMDARL